MKQLSEQAKLLKDYNKRKITKDKAKDVIAGWLNSNKYTMKELEMLFYLLDIKEDDFEQKIWIDSKQYTEKELIEKFKEGRISKNEVGKLVAQTAKLSAKHPIDCCSRIVNEIGFDCDDFNLMHSFNHDYKYVGDYYGANHYDKSNKEEKDDYIEERVEISDMMNQEELKEKEIEEDKNKKSIVDYDRQYNIHEVFTLLRNMPEDTKVTDSKQLYDWELSKRKNSLIRRDELANEYKDIDDYYFLKDIIDMTFKLVKEDEESKEKWIDINSLSELIALLESHKINKLKVDNEIFEFAKDDSELELFSDMVLSVFELSTLNSHSLSYVTFEK